MGLRPLYLDGGPVAAGRGEPAAFRAHDQRPGVTSLEHEHASPGVQDVHAASVAGESLTAIDSAVSRALEMNSEIASAAREQSQVIVDVERNILRIQQGADRTATETNEVGRATRELSELCMALQSGIGQFKLH